VSSGGGGTLFPGLLLSCPPAAAPLWWLTARLVVQAPPGVVAEGGGFLVRLHDMHAAASAWLEQAKQVRGPPPAPAGLRCCRSARPAWPPCHLFPPWPLAAA
jgi:hypothetical protein